jgi:hypothetical protein
MQTHADFLLKTLYDSGLFTAPESIPAIPEAATSGPEANDFHMKRYSEALVARHYSPRTRQSYTVWVRRFLEFHRGRESATLGEKDLNAFLSDLAVRGKVSSSTATRPWAGFRRRWCHFLDGLFEHAPE